MSAKMIDAHAHLSDLRLFGGVDKLVPELQKAGLMHMVLGGVDPDDWARQLQLVAQLPQFVTTVAGIHPWTVRDQSTDVLEEMFEKLTLIAPRVTAIGETGVDFFEMKDPVQRMKQPEWCERHLELATTLNKPVVLHVVKGHDVVLGLLKRYRGKPGIVHGWRGSEQDGRKYIDRAFVLSIGPRSIQRLKPSDLAWLPLENFVLESDGPDFPKLNQAPIHGREWVSAMRQVASFLAKSLKISIDEVWALNRDNLERVLQVAFTAG
jgi:TatD DNase family protein